MKTMSYAALLSTVAAMAVLGITLSSAVHAAAPAPGGPATAAPGRGGRGGRGAAGGAGAPNPSQEDHDRMAKLLGVTDIRPGARGQIAQANDPDFAPYDE